MAETAARVPDKARIKATQEGCVQLRSLHIQLKTAPTPGQGHHKAHLQRVVTQTTMAPWSRGKRTFETLVRINHKPSERYSEKDP